MNKNNSHMKTLSSIFAGLALLCAVVSCQLYKIDTQMTPEKAAASIRMECSAVDTYNLPAQNPGSISFNVSSNTPWTLTLSSDADWLSVSPASSAAGALIADVVVSAQSNPYTEDRTATLTLKGENVATTKVITIRQSRFGKLYVTPMVSEYSAAGGPLSFTIQTNLPWEVRSSEGWLSFNRESGEPDPEGRTLTIIATAAPSGVLERMATVTVVAGDDEESFDVVQKGSFSLTELSSAFASAGGSQSFTIKTDLPWEVSADKDWITFDKTSGEGTGAPVSITATASANEGALRKANVTVSAGGIDNTFEVSQNGFTFEIVTPASTELPSGVGEMLIEVSTSLSWEPESSNPAWTVEKVDDSHFKVVTAFNKYFVPQTGTVAIVSGTNKAELELTQPINFTFEGNYELLSDGSVKLIGDQASRIVLKEAQRYGIYDLEMGDVNFASNGNMWFENLVTGEGWSAQLYNWCAVGKTRLRAEGSVSSGKSMNEAGTSYMSASYDLSQDQFNAMTSYKMSVKPNADDETLLDMEFFYNGTSIQSAKCQNPFYGNEIGGNTFVGFHGAATAETWYVVKSFDVTVIE